MLKMCLNWKVISALAVLGVGIYAVAPNLVAVSLPILLLAICPLSMMLMMWSMRETGDQQSGLTSEEQLARLREQQTTLEGKIDALERTTNSEKTGARSDTRGWKHD